MRTLAKQLALGLLGTLTSLPTFAESTDVVTNPSAWESIRQEAFGSRLILDGTGKIALTAPERAEDAALVPIVVRLAPSFGSDVKTITLIVDQNPSPVVADFEFGEAAAQGERMLATRIRVDQYSSVRVIAQTYDGKMYMVSSFIKASGGCSTPASKDPEEAAKSMGRMIIKTAIAGSSGRDPEAEVMMKHPNTSGMAIDPITRGYPPARFISELTVKTAGKLIFAVKGGISLSEDPNFRFTYSGSPTDDMEVDAQDSMGTNFHGQSSSPLN